MESSSSLVQKQPIGFAEPIGRSVSLHTDTFSQPHDNVDIGDAQTRFEVARRSAEFYLEKYLQSSKDGPSQLDTSQDSSLDIARARGDEVRDGRYWRMKAARDSLIRDLNEMSFWVEHLALPQEPEVRIAMGGAFCFSGMTLYGLHLVGSKLLETLVGVGTGAGLLIFVSSLAYKTYQRQAYAHYKDTIPQCLDAAYGWTLTDQHLGMMKNFGRGWSVRERFFGHR